MKALVIYDSVFGNTEQVAQAIGTALQPDAETRVIRVTELSKEMLTDVDLLILGSPTRAFRPMPTISGWYKGLERNTLEGIKVAAFDTRSDITKINSGILTLLVKWFGYAAQPMAKGLEKKGGQSAADPAGFVVDDTEGPLRDGELERAADWARHMLTA